MSSNNSKDKEPFQARAELYAPTRFAPKVYELYRTRALATDVLAQQCWLLLLAIARIHCQRFSTEGTTSSATSCELPRVGILGGGHMGYAVAMNLIRNKYPIDHIAISTRQPERMPRVEALGSPHHQQLYQQLTRYFDNGRLSKESDVLILCMPPSQLKSVTIQIRHALGIADSSVVVISILCGTTHETLIKSCGTRLILRTHLHMPDLVTIAMGEDLLQGGSESNNPNEVSPGTSAAASTSPPAPARSTTETLRLAIQQLRHQDRRLTPVIDILRELASRRGQVTPTPETVKRILRIHAPDDTTTTAAAMPTLMRTPTPVSSRGVAVSSKHDLAADTLTPLTLEEEATPQLSDHCIWHSSWTATIVDLFDDEDEDLA